MVLLEAVEQAPFETRNNWHSQIPLVLNPTNTGFFSTLFRYD